MLTRMFSKLRNGHDLGDSVGPGGNSGCSHSESGDNVHQVRGSPPDGTVLHAVVESQAVPAGRRRRRRRRASGRAAEDGGEQPPIIFGVAEAEL